MDRILTDDLTDGVSQGPGTSAEDPAQGEASAYRPVLRTIARLIATDRRAALLASDAGEVLLANTPAKRLGLSAGALRTWLDWQKLRALAMRSGSAPVSLTLGRQTLEGELVYLPLGRAAGFLLRLSEHDDEAVWLRNRARAATLLRVSHDLRTPIQSLLASAEALTGRGADDSAVEDRLRAAADLALDRINNVLSVLRGEKEAGGAQPDEAFSPAEELQSLVQVVTPIAEARGAAVALSLPADSTIRAVGPLRYVRALFQNMIDNSIKHGGAEITVLLSVQERAGGMDAMAQAADWLDLTLRVRDLGGGLPEDQLARLAAALGQSKPWDRVPVPQAPGGGVRASAGLDVLAHALLQLGGDLEVRNVDAAGEPVEAGVAAAGMHMSARFSLQRAPDDEAAAEPVSPMVQGMLAGCTMLVVEDSPSSRSWLTHILRDAGAGVHGVGSGAEALAHLADTANAPVDLVLSDVTLPRMNGVQLARSIRAGRAAGTAPPGVKIVGLTAHVEDRIVAACLRAGMCRVLEKPIRPGPLCEALREVLDGGPVEPAPAPAIAARTSATEDSLWDRTVVADLTAALGRDGAAGFMTRALTEATAALATLRRDGVTADTARMLHAATGACGLTGLALVDARLRDLETAVKTAPDDISAPAIRLEQALADTSRAIQKHGA